MKKKTLEELEKELADLKASNSSQWDTYGSELCAGDMIRQEENLEKEIVKLKERERLKEKTIKRWEKSGLLDGLTGNVSENIGKMFESQLSHIIDESGTTTQFSDVVFPAIRRASDKIEDSK